MLVRVHSRRDTTTADIDFHPNHPRHVTHVQRIAHTHSEISTVTLQGQLTQFQAAEDAIPGGHPTTVAIVNDVAEILLGLFVPWEALPRLFQQHAYNITTQHDACSHIWSVIEPTLPPHNQAFARNVQLLRKSQEDCQADAALWKRSASNTHPDVHDPASLDSLSDDDGFYDHTDENYTAETLITAFYSIHKSWNQDITDNKQHPSTLLCESGYSRRLHLQNIHQLEIHDSIAVGTSGLQFTSSSTLVDWEMRFKDLTVSVNQNSTADDLPSSAFYLDDFNIDTMDGMFHPTFHTTHSVTSLPELPSHLYDKPTSASLMNLLYDKILLNDKQRIVVEKILSEALMWVEHPYDSSKRQQTLLYVGGEGGVGKSQIIKGIVLGMDILQRKDEVILMAPTGAAADNIGGNTYHTSLGISINPSRRATTGSRVKNLWSHKTIMIIDEASMVDLTMLSIINTHCKTARSLDRNSPDLFGGLPIVILIGDFFQFPPVRGPPLWKPPRNGNEHDQDGQLIWHQFQQVILLTEQMRQAKDPLFQNLLARARSGMLNGTDLTLLNEKVITSLTDPRLQDTITIVKSNSLRHIINRVCLEHFAITRHQKIYIFPAAHTRTRSTSPRFQLHLDDLLQIPDQGTKIPFPGLLLYTRNMPAMVLTNICTPLGLVNGATGRAVGVSIDPTGRLSPHFLLVLSTHH